MRQMAESTGGRGAVAALRPDIARSWRRAELFGVDPESGGRMSISDVDGGSRFMRAAGPVVRQLAAQLGDEPLCLMLADRNCRIVYQSSGDRRLQNALQRGGIVIGSGVDEHAAGTNALGTAFEIGHGLSINGAEHYLHGLKSFSCYGEPIRHPLTRRLEGVLDITGIGPRSNPLFGPLLLRAAQDIEARIVEGAREIERRLFLAFQHATRLRSSPIAVLGGDVVLANRSCLERLGSADPGVLGTLTAEVVARGHASRELDLGPMGRIPVDAERVEGTPDGVLYHLGTRLPPAPAGHGGWGGPTIAPSGRCLLITGEPGTGRTSRAQLEAGGEPVVTMDAAAAVTETARNWAARLVGLVAKGTAVVVVDDVDVLPESLCAIVRRAMTSASRTRLVLTSGPVAELPVPVARLVARCAQQIELPPLRDRRHELPALIAAMAARVRPGRELILTPRALEILGAQSWPGNLVELDQLVEELCSRPTRRIDVGDLPERYRSEARTVGRGGRERAERVAIVHSLQAAGGNKLRAAAMLGISRTTLYRRMRALDV